MFDSEQWASKSMRESMREHEEADARERTFRAMINLKELFVLSSARLKEKADTINSILPSTFNNC
jgi:hypothetical protein